MSDTLSRIQSGAPLPRITADMDPAIRRYATQVNDYLKGLSGILTQQNISLSTRNYVLISAWYDIQANSSKEYLTTQYDVRGRDYWWQIAFTSGTREASLTRPWYTTDSNLPSSQDHNFWGYPSGSNRIAFAAPGITSDDVLGWEPDLHGCQLELGIEGNTGYPFITIKNYSAQVQARVSISFGEAENPVTVVT